MASSLSMASLLSNMRMPNGVNPVTVNLPRPPRLEGTLAPNNVLAKAVRFADNMVMGPESMVVNNGYVYTGLANGWVVEVRPNGQVRKILRMSMNNCEQPNAPESACGRPLGVREHKGHLIVADAYHGIFKINPVNGRFEKLVDGRMRVNGRRLGGFINDLAVSKDGSIFFTSSSSKYTQSQSMDVILEGETSGRVLVYNPRFPGPMKVRELVTRLNLPNGLQLSKDENVLYIAEGARARIFKAYINKDSPKRGSLEMFAENLPGYVDNIRLSPRGTLWVGLSTVRHEGRPSVLDDYGNQPKVRGAIMGMPRQAVLQQSPRYGLVVELNSDGQIIRSLHDTSGTTFVGVSEVEEEKGVLYLASPNKPFIGKLNLADLPPAKSPDNSGNINSQLAVFLNQIRQRLMTMNNFQIRDIVISLVQNLVRAKLESLKLQSQTRSLQAEVVRLRNAIASMTTTTSPPGTTDQASDTTQAATTQPPATTAPGGAQTTTASGSTSQTTDAASDATTTAASGGDSTTTVGQTLTTTASATQTTTAGTSESTTDSDASTTTAAGLTTTGAGTDATTTAGATDSTTASASTTSGAATTTGGDTTTAASTTAASTAATTSA